MADLNLNVTESIKISPTELISSLAKTTPATLVEYLIANETIFPSGYDIAAVVGDGVTMRERSLSDSWLAALLGGGVISGFAVPNSSANFVLAMPSGIAILAGRTLTIPAVNLTCSPSVTSYVFLKLTRDANLNVTGAWYEVNTTGTQPADSLPMAAAITSGAAITDAWASWPLAGANNLPELPRSVGAGSTISHGADLSITTNSNLSGVHICRSFYVKAGITATVVAGKRRVVIIATGVITINGTVDANGKGIGGGAGGGTGAGARNGSGGATGTDQPGAIGGDSPAGPGYAAGGGSVLVHGHLLASPGTQVTGEDLTLAFASPSVMGGASGGGGGGNAIGSGGAGGSGGASIVLIAPKIILGAASVLNTAGGAGAAGGPNAGGGGGGGGGNIYITTRNYTDSGSTFIQTGGAGGANGGAGASNGTTGTDGIKQINILS